jgi:RNA polymerase sigma factor (TIGR02999 family)
MHRVHDSNDRENKSLLLERLQESLMQSNAVTSAMSNTPPTGAFLDVCGNQAMSATGRGESADPPGGFFPIVYDELKWLAAARLAGERAGHSLDATALVHEAYLRLGEASFADRSGFFRAAAIAMQRILVDHARRRKTARRGGGVRTLALEGEAPALGADPNLVLDVDAALERQAREDATAAEVARLRLLAGLSIDEAALAMGVSRATAFREWAYARSWLATALDPGE